MLNYALSLSYREKIVQHADKSYFKITKSVVSFFIRESKKGRLRKPMEAILILILKCLLLGIIWAALLIPVIFNRGGWLKYLITVLIIAVICYFCRRWAAIINRMTLIALITLVVSWITSMAVFEKESKVKSKVISFTCVMAAAAYLISHFISFGIL